MRKHLAAAVFVLLSVGPATGFAQQTSSAGSGPCTETDVSRAGIVQDYGVLAVRDRVYFHEKVHKRDEADWVDASGNKPWGGALITDLDMVQTPLAANPTTPQVLVLAGNHLYLNPNILAGADWVSLDRNAPWGETSLKSVALGYESGSTWGQFIYAMVSTDTKVYFLSTNTIYPPTGGVNTWLNVTQNKPWGSAVIQDIDTKPTLGTRGGVVLAGGVTYVSQIPWASNYPWGAIAQQQSGLQRIGATALHPFIGSVGSSVYYTAVGVAGTASTPWKLINDNKPWGQGKVQDVSAFSFSVSEPWSTAAIAFIAAGGKPYIHWAPYNPARTPDGMNDYDWEDASDNAPWNQAGGPCGGSSSSASSATSSSAQSSSSATAAQCSNSTDDDGDGKIDGADPGCHSDGNPYNPSSYNPNDNDESNPGNAQCNDGADNDADGVADMQDPGCHSDANAGNPASYVPLDNDEFNAASSSSASVPQCRDGQDNDGDGATDFPSDFSCSGSEDNDETFPKAQCQDGADNDGDGKVDSVDPGCHYDGNAGNPNSFNPQDNDEFNVASSSASSALPQCRDGVDNDFDGAADYPSDFSCSHPDDTDETFPKAQCQDGFDNDGDGLIDFPNDPGCASRQDNDEYSAASSAPFTPQCRDNIDNDGDGAVDYNDPGCYLNGIYNPNDNDESTQASSSSSSSAGVLGCILVLNETFNAAGQPLQPSAQFTYTLDGQRTAANDAGGVARFDGVPVGTHTVAQGTNGAWTNLSVTPTGGTVWVPGGTSCAAVVFKNRQNSIGGGQSSSTYSWYDPYGDDGYDEPEETPLCRALRAKYGERYDNVKKRKKLPKSVRRALEECDDLGSPYGGYGYGSR